MDIKRPSQPKSKPIIKPDLNQNSAGSLNNQTVPTKPDTGLKVNSSKRIILIVSLSLITLSLLIAGWFVWQLRPLDTKAEKRQVVIEPGQSPASIAHELQSEKIIRSAVAFSWYVKFKGYENQLQAGTYALSGSQSLASVAADLHSGRVTYLDITIIPGQTIKQITDQLVKKYGYSNAAVKAALSASYDSPLLAGKPAASSLEGYIFPETYRVSPGDPLNKLFETSFKQLYDQIVKRGLVAKFKTQGVNLRQAVILASIIQAETADPTEQAQVAQVFFKRLRSDMVLGSDPTFVYAAKQLGVTPGPGLDSPYNTRLHKGLPPGPIGNFNLSALLAVAQPAQGDYLYFVAGDNGKTYFAKTYEQHQANIEAHCHILCQ